MSDFIFASTGEPKTYSLIVCCSAGCEMGVHNYALMVGRFLRQILKCDQRRF